MDKKIEIELITPEKIAYKGYADQISLTTTTGEITVLPKHLNLVTSLAPGEIRIKNDNQELVFATGTGFATISGKKVIIATNLANTPEEIDEAQVIEAKKRAEELLKEKTRLSEEEFAQTIASLEKALVQLKVKRRHHHKKEKLI
ncbi:MAG: ATP synthase F1 subunit epsilon [Nitrososphaerota archaeon]